MFGFASGKTSFSHFVENSTLKKQISTLGFPRNFPFIKINCTFINGLWMKIIVFVSLFVGPASLISFGRSRLATQEREKSLWKIIDLELWNHIFVNEIKNMKLCGCLWMAGLSSRSRAEGKYLVLSYTARNIVCESEWWYFQKAKRFQFLSSFTIAEEERNELGQEVSRGINRMEGTTFIREKMKRKSLLVSTAKSSHSKRRLISSANT